MVAGVCGWGIFVIARGCTPFEVSQQRLACLRHTLARVMTTSLTSGVYIKSFRFKTVSFNVLLLATPITKCQGQGPCCCGTFRMPCIAVKASASPWPTACACRATEFSDVPRQLQPFALELVQTLLEGSAVSFYTLNLHQIQPISLPSNLLPFHV